MHTAALQNIKDKTSAPLIKGQEDCRALRTAKENAGKSVDATPFPLEDMLKEKYRW